MTSCACQGGSYAVLKDMVSHAIVHKAQDKKYNCGPVSLAMLLDFYGIPHVADDLEALCETSPDHGTNHSNIVAAAKTLGASVVEKENANIDDLAAVLESGHPVLINYFNPITHIGHFAIVKGIDEGSVVLADLKNGDNFRMSFEDFESHWHNHNKTLLRWMMHLI